MDDGMQVFREQAQQILLGNADAADRGGKPHVARSERYLASIALSGEIDDGYTVSTLVQAVL